MIKRKLLIAILSLVVLLSTSLVYPLEVPTHKLINKRIAEGDLNGFSFDAYLKTNLGFIEGRRMSVNGQTAGMWMKQ